MNKILLSIALVVFSGATVMGQSKAPAKAVNYLNTQYPGASNVEWEAEDGMFEAEFNYNDHEMEASFDAEGSLIATSTRILWAEVPANVMLAHKQSEHKTTIPYDIYRVEAVTGEIVYHILVKDQWNANPQDLIFANDGDFLGVAVDEDDEDEDDDEDGE